tara:strand:+ start:41 stop:421 length:381 start_codon:yes stop_codon:yes gene_type:complete
MKFVQNVIKHEPSLPTSMLSILFVLCIIVRFTFVYIVSILDKKWLKLAGIIGLLISGGLLYNYIINKRIGGLSGRVWWQKYRPLHAGLYAAFGLMALMGDKGAYIPLLIDTIIGIVVFVYYKINSL